MSGGESTTAQLITLAVLPKVSGSLSMLGSGFIVLEILRDRKKRDQMYHRLLLGMSCLDIVVSFFMAMSTWLAPSESDILWAVGTQTTCQIQAFMTQFAYSSLSYNLGLAIYYLLVVGHSKRDRQLHTIEVAAHCCSLLLGLSLAIAGLALGVYRPTTLWCSNATGHSFRSSVVEHEIHRDWFFMFAVGAVLWIIIFCVTFVMIRVFCIVRQQERHVQKWRHGSLYAANKLTRQVAAQAFWYSASFYVTWIVPTIGQILMATRGSIPFGVRVVFSISMPCQGLLNSLVYMRPRYKHILRACPEMSRFSAMKHVIFKTLVFWKEDEDESASVDDGMNPAAEMEVLDEREGEGNGEVESSGPSGTPKISIAVTT
uniref:G-protein coupled receptors family 1 profile domain-containing protein n=1 Tax=Pseudictyota dubia TaxID=2749911 RepID=A0A7R9ZI35_9STRA|mmetsp:Transcript_8171/g.14974  ORF Transcript_8171/g.14974 Transcript_8171/m.14974 type:complete len:372 (+) Transcript_8171:163-1278(+)